MLVVHVYNAGQTTEMPESEAIKVMEKALASPSNAVFTLVRRTANVLEVRSPDHDIYVQLER